MYSNLQLLIYEYIRDDSFRNLTLHQWVHGKDESNNNYMDLKKAAAQEAIKYIQPGTDIGLGAGSTVAHLVHLLRAKYQANMPLRLCTSSFTTNALLQQLQLEVLSITAIDHIDIYFDGCDELDADLNALKSGGGIHTMEKLFASRSSQFIILGDQKKLVTKFTGNVPVVAEVIAWASSYVFNQIQKSLSPLKIEWRMSNKSDGPVVTSSGNYLLDIYFAEWPELATLNHQLKMITGVVEISLFHKLVDMAIMGTDEGIKILKR
jgi:ribose 5-phosphate isomerase A